MALVKFYRGVNANQGQHLDGLYFTTDQVDGVYKLYFPGKDGKAYPIADYASQITELKTVDLAHDKAIKELQGTVTGYDSTNTIKAAIDAIEADIAAHGVLSVNAGDDNSSALTISPNSGAVKVALKVDGSTIIDSSGSLAVGSIAQSKVTGLTQALNEKADQTALNTLEVSIGGTYSAANTVYADIQAAKKAGVTKLSSGDSFVNVSAATGEVTLSIDNTALAESTAFTDTYLKINDGTVTLTTETTPTSGMLKTYNIKQGGSSIGKIDIPKDFLVKSGSIVTGTWNNNTFTPSTSGTDKALALVINSKDSGATDETLYINVKDLVDVYTAGDGVAISNANVVSVNYNTSDKYLTISDGKLATKGIDAAISTATDAVSISGGNTATTGKYVSAVNASGKKITVTTADLPTLAKVDNPTGSGIATQVITGITVNGHTITTSSAHVPSVTAGAGIVVGDDGSGVENAKVVVKTNLNSETKLASTAEAVYNVALNSAGNLAVQVNDLLWVDC